ncbi:MAG: hypothetical protein K0S58_815 [Nitrospira sp.]|jgi:mRNA-degrading endonuclease YafQ of YafQ-DinJ toxin-antitoxin module|nr:hypothetical protein [Nitrospira sp.]
MYVLMATAHFDRRVGTFTRAHPELKKPLAKVLHSLELDPFRPHLRLHPLKGELEGLHAVSVTHLGGRRLMKGYLAHEMA